MKVVSFSDYEAGILAIGGSPIGIVAIGGFPVGLVAVGILPRGVVSVACGVSVGLVSVACGVSVGGFATGVGPTFGLRAAGLPTLMNVFGPRPEAPQGRSVVPVHVLKEAASEGWIAARVDAEGRLVPPEELSRATMIVAERVHQEARSLRSEDVAALVRVRSTARPNAQYRERAEELVEVEWLRIEPAQPRRPMKAWLLYGAQTAAKLTVVVAALTVGGYTVAEQLANLRMTRHAELTWTATVKSVERTDLAPGTACAVSAEVRTDGRERLHVWPVVRCGGRDLYEEGKLTGCVLAEQTAQDGHGFVYQLACSDAGHEESDDSSGSPGLRFDTFKAPPDVLVHSLDPPRWQVVVELHPQSAPREGARLLDRGELPSAP